MPFETNEKTPWRKEEIISEMFQKCNEKRAFLPEQFDIFTVRSFHRHFGEYKHAKSSDKKYAKILIDHKIADEIKETSF